MAPKEKVIHRQQFQNAQQIIEVTVKNKPKVKLIKSTINNNKRHEPFVRDCVLKNELDKLMKEEEEKRLKIKEKKMNQERPMPKLKINHPKTVLEIEKKIKKKKKEKKNHDTLPPGMTWGEYLKNMSSSRTSVSDHSNMLAANNNIEIINEHVKRKQKEAAEKIAMLERKHISHNQNYRTKTPELHCDTPESMVNKDNPLHPSVENLTNKVTKLCKAAQVNKAIQTSHICITEVPPLDLPDSQKSVPVSKLNKSHNQTHSPFGESAIRLLNNLRERLQSRGDSEGSEIINALEAYFGSAESRMNGKRVDIGNSASPVFPISIPKSDTATPTFEKDKLEKIIAEQQKKLDEQEDTIQKLNSFSKKVIGYHKDLLNLISGSYSNVHNRYNIVGDCKHVKSSDSGIDLNHSDDLTVKLRALLEEKERLEKTVKEQKDEIERLEMTGKEQKYEIERLDKIIDDQKNTLMRLELEFHQFKKEHQYYNNTRRPASANGRYVNRGERHQYDNNTRRPASANGRYVNRGERPSSREKGVHINSLLKTEAALMFRTPNVNDENDDSAFEERSSKSVSRPSSRLLCNKHLLKEVNPYESWEESLSTLHFSESDHKESSVSTQDSEFIGSNIEILSQVPLEGRAINGAGTPVFSETLIRDAPDGGYLESTHLNSRKTRPEFNGRDVGNIQRTGFSAIDVSSLNESETLMPIRETNESETLMPITEL